MVQSVWITGPSRSGKTTRLVEHLRTWIHRDRTTPGWLGLPKPPRKSPRPSTRLSFTPSPDPRLQPGILALAANRDNRSGLADQLAIATQGRYTLNCTTPLGFFQDEVILFYPLLIQQLNLKAQFPVRLRPENEQDLATRLWRHELDRMALRQRGVSEQRFVRRSLDLLQLAALSGTPPEDIPMLLAEGLATQPDVLVDHFGMDEIDAQVNTAPTWVWVGELLMQWRNWCLDQGLLTYGIIGELYWRYLLPDETYQSYLAQRYRIVLADDVDNYPAITRDLFEVLLDQNAIAAFTYDPDGAVRLGLGADPLHLAGLRDRCQLEVTQHVPAASQINTFDASNLDWINDPALLSDLPESIRSLQTSTRGQLLRQLAEVIHQAIQSNQVQPQEVAIIAPGLDAIARYTLVEILTRKGLSVESLNDQRPLADSPTIRALLTLLALVYPGLGRLIDREAIAEMLVVLTQKGHWGEGERGDSSSLWVANPFAIDPVRAGLLVDHCFEPHPEHPRLLPAATFSRWDRLGYQASVAYQELVDWLDTQKRQLQQRLIPSPVAFLDRAIQRFLWNTSQLPFDQLSALRELIETAQHYWDVDTRLRQSQTASASLSETVGHFIQLLQNGTVTANPYPVRPMGASQKAITLATVFQYRSSRRAHRWQFWLDAGSPRWLSGVDALFCAPLFLRERLGRPWTVEDTITANEQRLRRILLDLLSRAGDRIYLCHSDLATNGQEQTGPLLSLVNLSIPIALEEAEPLPEAHEPVQSLY